MFSVRTVCLEIFLMITALYFSGKLNLTVDEYCLGRQFASTVNLSFLGRLGNFLEVAVLSTEYLPRKEFNFNVRNLTVLLQI